MFDETSFSTTSFSVDSWYFGDVVAAAVDYGAPWWEAEKGKKKKVEVVVLKNTANHIALLLMTPH